MVRPHHFYLYIKIFIYVIVVRANLKETSRFFCKCYCVRRDYYFCMHAASTCNPYIELLVDGKSGALQKTDTLKKTWKPEWHEEFEL